MLEESIKKANIQAMKDKNMNLRSLYSVILNKFQMSALDARAKGKEITDDDRVRIIQKTIIELNEEIEGYTKVGGHENIVSDKRAQIKELEKYLPKMLSREEIESILRALPDHSVPFVMKHMKSTYGNTVDMKLVQEVLKSI